MKLREVLIYGETKGYLHKFISGDSGGPYGIIELENGEICNGGFPEIKFVPSTKQMENTNPE